MDLKIFEEYSSILVRISISLVFLWFGFNQLFLPKDFIGYLPVFLLNYVSAGNLIMFNGLFELIFGTMLILGFFTRVTAFILAGHLFSIMLSLGYNDVAVRDFGLSLATFSILLRGSDKWCLDQKIR